MLEKLLSLLLHAKSGAVATVLVLGASGALVTATVDNGMTTITITQPGETTESTNTESTTTTTVSEAILALFNRTSAEDDPTAPATAKGCSDEAHERNVEMKRVNAHAKTTRDAVEELGDDAPRTSAARKLVHDADKEIKDLRRAAVKAIHETFDCDKDDDEDEDEDQDEDEDDSNTTDPVFTGDDATVIADLAIARMDEVVAKLEVDLEGLGEATTTANTRQNSGKSDKDKHDNKGKGNSRDNDRHGGGDDDEDDD